VLLHIILIKYPEMKSYNNYHRIILFLLLIMLSANSGFAQQLTGKVSAKEGESTFPLVGANLRWLGTTNGTVSNESGSFSLVLPDSLPARLIASYIGYKADTITVSSSKPLHIQLISAEQLQEEVVISASPTYISKVEPRKMEVITRKELQKAACCNLSESFETNASVDVSFSDAVTGAKQIQMLGLDGVYTQIMTENVPAVRGLAAAYGLSYTSGTWVQSIDVGKGAGSVVNGYESITGQINVELLKPEDSERFYLNLYANHMGRTEANIHLAQKLGKKWSTGLLFHTDRMRTTVDRNGDGFLDMPHSTQYSLVNRWKYDGDRLKSQFGVKLLTEDKMGGQVNFDPSDKAHQYHTGVYGTGMDTRRVEVFAKNGIIFPSKPYKGLGLVTSATYHKQNAFFGLNNYDGTQKTFYGNLIYQSIIGNTNHQFKTGFNYLYDEYNEVFADSAFARTESVPGAYGEYTFSGINKFTAVAGLRADFHNIYGPFLTPRLHLKYDLSEATTLRASTGRGLRVANPLAENTSALVSSRQIIVRNRLMPEVAWNYGLNLTHDFHLNNKPGMVTLDLYRTDFQNQVVMDMDASVRQILFYNLDGKSFANSFQAELQYEPVKSLSMKTAYKFYDVKTTLNGKLQQRPFVSRHRFFFNTGYATKFDKWKFDFTTQWHGPKRIPDTADNPAEHRLNAYSPSFFVFNAQVTKAFRKWDAYLGVENLGNFKQANPIVSTDQPFSPNFDASMVWGPIVGRMVYAGMRFSIK
jgi:outer membrane receptor for ferrienterochelin and colicins